MATRRERVVLELDDDFTSGMARAAAATALLRRQLDDLSGSSTRASRGMDTSERSVLRLGRGGDQAGNQIDKLSGRMVLFAEAAGALGPAFIPIGAVAVPALTGLASSFGFAALAGGVAIGAFQGVGGALEAMNKAHLEPTAENLAKAQEAMNNISPAAQAFVGQIRSMGPAMRDLRDIGAEGLFPGLTAGLDAMESRLPDVGRIVGAVAGELGNISESVGESLASERWNDFFDFLATDAPPALRDMADGVGNLTHGLAEMWMAFDPVNDDFSTWMVRVTGDFDRWASGLSQTDGFAEFIQYLNTTGPQVGAALGAIGNALLQIVEAAAPIGGPVLAGIEAFANAIAAIADSDLGTPIFGMVAALSALNLAMRATGALSRAAFTGPAITAMGRQRTALQGLRADWAAYSAVTRTAQGRAQATATQMIAHHAAAQRLGTSLRAVGANAGKAGALVGAMAVLTTGAGESMGITNTAALGLAGSMAGPWGAAIGAATGAAIDLSHANDDLETSVTRARAAMRSGDVDEMASAYQRLGEGIRETTNVDQTLNPFSSAMDRAQGMMGVLSGAVSRARAQMEGLRGAQTGAAAFEAGAGIAAQFGLMGRSAAEAKRQIESLNATLRAGDKEVTKQGAMDAYVSSVLDARDAMRQYGDVLTTTGLAARGHTRAGLAARAALRNMATTAAVAAGKIENLDKATRWVNTARADFIRLAQGMGMGRAAAARMATSFGLTGAGARTAGQRVRDLDNRIRALKSKLVRVQENGAGPSSARVQSLKAQIAALQNRRVEITTTYTTIRRTINYSGGGTRMGGGVPQHASGGTIAGPRLPYRDSVLIHAAPTEEVISNDRGQADRWRHLLKAVNANANPALIASLAAQARRYADGGTVGGSTGTPSVSVGGPSVRVFIDGNEVRAVVDDRIAAHQDIAGQRARI